MTAIQLKTPLREGKRSVLIIMDRVARLTNLQYFVVGATARDILMYHFHGFPLNRASPDIDFAMAIESWHRLLDDGGKAVDALAEINGVAMHINLQLIVQPEHRTARVFRSSPIAAMRRYLPIRA